MFRKESARCLAKPDQGFWSEVDVQLSSGEPRKTSWCLAKWWMRLPWWEICHHSRDMSLASSSMPAPPKTLLQRYCTGFKKHWCWTVNFKCLCGNMDSCPEADEEISWNTWRVSAECYVPQLAQLLLSVWFGGGGVFHHFGTEGAGLNEEKVVMVGYLTRALDFMS